MFSSTKIPGGRIQILPPLLAQKIAAGEVIERPQSVVRELLDNAIDSGATSIDLSLEDGGNARIIVQDDGSGMDSENLRLAWLPHATSKIVIESDLYDIRTLGFRGEALSSIAAVSQLVINSTNGNDGATLEVHGGGQIRLDPFQGKTGTRVEVRNLFYNLPARKQFLKRSATESAMCKTVLVDKALAHPGISFRMFNETGMSLFLPACFGEKAALNRYRAVYPDLIGQSDFFHEIMVRFNEGEVKLLIGRPEIYQHDRRMIQIFVNRRRINEYSLVQAIEYGFTGFLPGGRFPVAACFLEINPERLDVNIHPAKREVKIRDLQVIHSQIVRSIQNFLRTSVHQRQIIEQKEIQYQLPNYSEKPGLKQGASNQILQTYYHNDAVQPSFDRSQRFEASTVAESVVVDQMSNGPAFRYLGLVFGVFLIVAIDQRLMMLDMHAAHERILYDRFRLDGKRQDLLVPIIFNTENGEADKALDGISPELESMGIRVENMQAGQWALSSVPACFAAKTSVITEILESPGLYLENIERSLFATLACRAAIKDGDSIGYEQAIRLIQEAIALPEQRCPHGRPIFFALSKEELFELVGRKV